MSRRSKIWRVVAVLFTLLNAAGAVWAAVMGEPLHCALHVVLTLLGGFWLLVLARGRSARDTVLAAATGTTGQPRAFDDQLSSLERSMDAVALEVERIGESQRFMTRLFTERGTPQTAGEGAAAPSEGEPGKAPPNVRRG
jgi:hypothetical protein